MYIVIPKHSLPHFTCRCVFQLRHIAYRNYLPSRPRLSWYVTIRPWYRHILFHWSNLNHYEIQFCWQMKILFESLHNDTLNLHHSHVFKLIRRVSANDDRWAHENATFIFNSCSLAIIVDVTGIELFVLQHEKPSFQGVTIFIQTCYEPITLSIVEIKSISTANGWREQLGFKLCFLETHST